MVSKHDLGSACAQDLKLLERGASFQGEDIFKGDKERGMMEEEVSLLLFPTIVDTILNLDEREQWEDFLKRVVDGENPSFFMMGVRIQPHMQIHSAFLCPFVRIEEGDEAIGGASLQLKGMAHVCWFGSPSYIAKQMQEHMKHSLRV